MEAALVPVKVTAGCAAQGCPRLVPLMITALPGRPSTSTGERRGDTALRRVLTTWMQNILERLAGPEMPDVTLARAEIDLEGPPDRVREGIELEPCPFESLRRGVHVVVRRDRVGEAYSGNGLIQISTAGTRTNYLASGSRTDGPLADARASYVNSLATDALGNLFFSESGYYSYDFNGIRRVSPADFVTTVVGGIPACSMRSERRLASTLQADWHSARPASSTWSTRAIT